MALTTMQITCKVQIHTRTYTRTNAVSHRSPLNQPFSRTAFTATAPRPLLKCFSTSPSAAENASPDQDETVFYEGSGSNAELAISLLLAPTLLYLPLTLASIGRRLWVSYKFTNKRLMIITNSPVLKREVQVEYSKIKEIRSVPRGFGAWGDCVFFLKDGSRLELAGLEDYKRIIDYVEGFIKTE